MSFFNITKQYLAISPAAFGLDISDTSLKYVQLEPEEGYFDLRVYGQKDIPKGIVEKGVIKKPSELSAILKKSLVKEGPKGLSSYAVFSLPDEETFLKQIRLPEMSDDELENAVYIEAEGNIPIDINDAYLDYNILKRHKDKNGFHIDVLLAAARRSSVDTYTEVLLEAGITPVALEPEVVAISRSAILGGKSKEPVLIAEIGANRTRLVAFVEEAVVFTGAVNFSADALNESLAKLLGMEKSKIIRLTDKSEEFKDKKFADAFEDALRVELKPLVEAIQNYTVFYKTQEEKDGDTSRPFEKVLVSGGGSRAPAIEKQLSLILKVPTGQVNPWVNVLPPELKETPQLNLDESVRFTTAIGLALRGIQNGLKEML
ncbi:MAG: type IV pilus assembly protein PilM [Candidatus Spechtbacterales bacterium]